MESDRVTSSFHMIDHAISLQKVANYLDVNESKEPDTTLFYGKFLAAPILMTLAVEIALKALQCQEGKEEFDRDHNLVSLFQGLNEDTQARLKVRLPSILDAVSLRLGVQHFCPVGAGIEKVLEHHQNTFIDWRYLYERRGDKSCYLPELNKVLAAIIETYKERELQRNYIGKMTENNDT